MVEWPSPVSAQRQQDKHTHNQVVFQPARDRLAQKMALNTPLFDFLRYPSVVGNNQLWLLAVVVTPLHTNKRCKES